MKNNRILRLALLPGLVVVALFAAFTSFKTSSAKPVVVWPQIQVTLLTGGLSVPVDLTHAGDGSGRLFIVQQSGQIRIYKNNSLLATPFLDISGRVNYDGGEQGLLSLAFPPGFASKRYFFVYYTRPDGNNQVSRFYMSTNPDLADPNSEEPILTLPHPTYGNHNGAKLAFGPDGYLYIGPGDGGGGGDPFGNGQNKGSLLGKMLRIDVQLGGNPPVVVSNPIYLPIIAGKSHAPSPYLVPPTNPFTNTVGARGEIWAYGLRNPWRFSFDRLTGDLYIGDVGQETYEEINFQPAASQGGENYGWNELEGNHCYPPGSGCTPPTAYVPPVTEYEHGANDINGCSVTGGYVYRGSAYPGLQGFYFYGDYCRGKIWAMKFDSGAWQTSMLIQPPNLLISSFGEDESGELYVINRNGNIYRLIEGSVSQ